MMNSGRNVAMKPTNFVIMPSIFVSYLCSLFWKSQMNRCLDQRTPHLWQRTMSTPNSLFSCFVSEFLWVIRFCVFFDRIVHSTDC